MGDAEMADLNTATIAAGQATVAELLGQASMMPFLSTRRLLVAHDWLNHLDRRMAASKSTDSAAHGEAAQLMAGFATLADSSDLVFIEAKGVDKRRQLWKGFKTTGGEEVAGLNALGKSGVIKVEEYGTPDPKALPGWIKRRAGQKQISIDGRAVQMLARLRRSQSAPAGQRTGQVGCLCVRPHYHR